MMRRGICSHPCTKIQSYSTVKRAPAPFLARPEQVRHIEIADERAIEMSLCNLDTFHDPGQAQPVLPLCNCVKTRSIVIAHVHVVRVRSIKKC